MDLKIRKIGSILKTNKKGYLIKESSIGKIKSPWKKAVDDLKKELIINLGKSIHSIYIRGSVAKGASIKGVSDLDGIVIVRRKLSNTLWLNNVREKLLSKYKFITKLDIHIEPISRTTKKYKDYNRRFEIKIQSVCIYGKDLGKNFEEFKPTKFMACRQNGYLMHDEINKLKNELKRSKDKRTRLWCTWIMKRILRTGALLTLEKEKAFTRDLYPAYSLFSKYYPSKEGEMKKCLEFAVFPTTNKNEIIKLVNGIGKFVLKEANSKL
ncbi:MAG: hypothetical protein IH845_01045 [Nanoarchaeota archaeon]|nr:hypothetical protein [Nanoarchaeota archaeon]